MVIYIFIPILLLLTACSQEKSSPQYNELPDKLTCQLFENMSKKDFQEYKKSLDALRAIRSQDVFLNELKSIDDKGILIYEIDTAIKNNDMKTAILKANLLGDNRVKKQVENLQVINNYLIGFPYKTPESMRRAINYLKKNIDSNGNHQIKEFVIDQDLILEKLNLSEYESKLLDAISHFRKDVIASSRYSQIVMQIIDNKKISPEEIKNYLERLKLFAPHFEKIKLEDFSKKLELSKFDWSESLTKAAQLFQQNKIEDGYIELKEIITTRPNISSALQMSLVSQSEDLSKIIEEMESFNLELLMKEYRRQKKSEEINTNIPEEKTHGENE